MMESVAVLVRKKGPDWRFVWSRLYGYWRYTSRAGNEYRIFGCDGSHLGIWVGRLVDGVWINAQSQIGGVSIHFPMGGAWYFSERRTDTAEAEPTEGD